MAKQDLHFSITATNEDLKRKLAESRQAILDSGKTAEATASHIDGSFKRMAISAAAGFSAISFGKSIVRVRGEMQMMEQSFDVLLGSKAKATQMIAQIKQLAIDSPLEMPQVSGAVQTLLGFGVEAEKVMGIVGQLSDVSMGNADRFRSLALVYAQTQSAGKLMGQDLLQMINAGFNPLQVIADKTGKSIGALKEEMSKGAISAEMVAEAFATVTSEGGKFYQMTQKQADGIVGLQATFEDAITNQLNKLGHEYEGLIEGGYRFATSVVENADAIVAALLPIIATYGTYKASIIAINAIGKVRESSFAAVEIAELSKLLPVKQASANADIAQAVAKGHLSQATAERLLAVRAEVQAELEGLRTKAQTLATEAVAAAQAHKSALQRSVAARQNMALAQAQMQIAIQGGSAEEIAAAKTAARTAKLEVNSSAIAVNTTRQALGAAQSQSSAAATAVDTMQTNLNTVATRSATTAKTLWTAATMRLTKAFHSLKLAFASNPIGMILTGVTMAISLFTMFKDKTEDATSIVDDLSKATDNYKDSVQSLNADIDKYEQLQNKAKTEAGLSEAEHTELNRIMETMITTVPNLKGAFDQYGNALSINIDQVKSYSKEHKKAYKDVLENNISAAETQKATLEKQLSYYSKIFTQGKKIKYESVIDGQIGETTTYKQVEKLVQASDEDKKAAREKWVELNADLTKLNTTLVTSKDALKDVNAALVNGNGKTSEALKNKAYWEGQKKVAQEALDAMTEAEKGTVKWIAERKKLNEANAALKTWDYSSAKSSTTKDHTNEVQEILLKAEQEKINIMQEGREKELAQIEQTRIEKLAAIDKEQKDIAAKLKEQGKVLTPQENGIFDERRDNVATVSEQGASAVNQKYDSEITDHWRALTSVFLSEEEKRTGAIKDRYDKEREWASKGLAKTPLLGAVVTMQIDAAENHEVHTQQLKEYENFAQQYLEKAKVFKSNILAVQSDLQAQRDRLVQSGASKKELSQFDEQAQKQLDTVNEIQVEMLGQLDEQLGLKNEAFVTFMEGVADAGVEELIAKLAEAEALLKAAQQNNTGEDSGNIQTYQAQVAMLKKQLTTAQASDKTSKDDIQIKKYKATLIAVTEVGKAAQDIAESFDGLDGNISDIMKSAGKLSSSIGALLSSITMMSVSSQATITTTSIAGMVAITTTSTVASTAIQQVEKASVILAIIGAALQIVMAIADALKGVFNDDKAREAEIQRLQRQIDALAKSYEALEKAIDKAYSADAAQLLGQSDELLRKQRMLIAQQIREEEGKKDSDGGQIDEWRKKIEEIDAQIEENKESAVDVIFGSDVESAIDDFASAYMDAWASGEDRAQSQKDVVKKMLRDIIQEMLKSDISKQVKVMREKIAGFMDDDVLSDSELLEIEKMGDEIGQIMEKRGQMYDKILKDDAAKNEDSLTGAIRGSVATEASVAELGGIFRGQYDKLSSIDNRLVTGFQGMIEMARTNAQIEANTRATAANTAATVTTLAAGFTELKTELSQINNNTKRDNGSY